MSEVNTDKPCPFCGNAVIQTTVDDGYHWCSCPKCSATGPTEFLRSDEGSPGWNTRPDFDAQRLRADTAEADLAIWKTKACEAAERHVAAELRIAELKSVLKRMLEDDALNPNPERHYSDCATNNRGVPELLGPCDCGYEGKPK